MSQVGLRMCVWLHYSSFGSTIRRARLVIERLQVQIPAGAAGEFSSSDLTLCADSYLVSIPPLCYTVACKRARSFCQKCRWQVVPKHTYAFDQTKLEWAYYAAVQE